MKGALSASQGLLDAEQVADYIGLPSARAVYNRRHRGDFPPAIRIGGSIRWRVSDIEAYLDANSEGGEVAGR